MNVCVSCGHGAGLHGDRAVWPACEGGLNGTDTPSLKQELPERDVPGMTSEWIRNAPFLGVQRSCGCKGYVHGE